MSNYYLLDHRTGSAKWYASRSRPLVGIVVHCTAGLQAQYGHNDTSAERTAAWCASSDVSSSWHSGSDTDSVIELLPPTYTAWHCRGYNSPTYGHEISKTDMRWSDEDPDWITATLGQAAGHLHKVATEHGIPIRKITRTQLDRAIAAGDPAMGGFVGHLELDPSRRSDPGADFPWTRFIRLVRNPTSTPTTGGTPMLNLQPGDTGDEVQAMQRIILYCDPDALPEFGADGDWGAETSAGLKKVIGATGRLGPNRYARLLAALAKAQGGARGPRGPKGAKGDPGPRGPRGAKGPAGPMPTEVHITGKVVS